MASAIAKTGAKRVYLLGRRADVLSTAAQTLNASPTVTDGTVVPLPTDINSPASVAAAAAHVERDAGYLDVLINNAGKIGPPNKPALEAQTVEELQQILLTGFDENDADWVDTLRTNTASVALVSASFLHLLDRGNARRGWQAGRVPPEQTRRREVHGVEEGGVDEGDLRLAQIITVASIAGFNRHVTAGVAYSASKAAAVHIGKILSTLLVPWGIRSNVIAPGGELFFFSSFFLSFFPRGFLFSPLRANWWSHKHSVSERHDGRV